MAEIYDNIERHFRNGLQSILKMGGIKRADFCVGYFNLRGWDMVVDHIDNIPGGEVYEKNVANNRNERKQRVCRLLVGMQRPEKEIIQEYYSHCGTAVDNDYVSKCKLKMAQQFREQLQLGLPTSEDEQTLQHLSRQLKKGKVCVKLYLRCPLHAKLYIAHRPDDPVNKIACIMGSSNLTYSGFMGNGELNADFTDSDHTRKLSKWFDDRWNDRYSVDITNELIQAIDTSWASEQVIPPYYIYLKTAYHLSQDARDGVSEFSLSRRFRHDLFDFQQIAAKIAARHLCNEKRRGAMIGDVVGLGKTITACAVAKIFEENYGTSSLIICPANLVTMWQMYVSNYDLKAEVQSIAKSLDTDRPRHYGLVIIDESHNLRSGTHSRRYVNVKTFISKINSPVLLLTATPYNKQYHDLANQLKLFIDEDQDLGIRPERYIESLGGERAFMNKHTETFIRSIGAFEKSEFPEDWNDLMKLFLIRRTRTFIKNSDYIKTDPADGRKYLLFPDGTRSYFPERLPCALKFPTVEGDQYSRLYSETMISLMEDLILPRYGLSNYLLPNVKATEPEQKTIDNLSRAGNRMMGFCKSTFFKRIDSCGFSFLLTVYRHILRNMVFVYAIDNDLPLPIGDEEELPDDYLDDDDINATLFDDEEGNVDEDGSISFLTDLNKYLTIAAGHYWKVEKEDKVCWLPSKYFKSNLRDHLMADCDRLVQMIELCGAWQPAEDQKIAELHNLLTEKHPDDKVLVFTQYADTAIYVHRQLTQRGIHSIDCATGKSGNATSLAVQFSPVSNNAKRLPNELRVLITTDVLSEGQNLQDAHVIVNYDLPWAIIRLIQRAGRVDRIGQTSQSIYCYSFFPAEGVEKIIKLRGRLNERINQNAGVIGSDEVFFEGNRQNLRDMFNEKAGVLDDEEDVDVDLSSQAYQIWKNATDANPQLRTIIPAMNNMVYSTKSADAVAEEQAPANGVITYARTSNDFDLLTWLDAEGNVVSQSQLRILKAMACSLDTPAIAPAAGHHQLVARAVAIAREQGTANQGGGILGGRNTPRYRIIRLLERVYNYPTDLFYTQEKKNTIKLIIDDIYNHPLLDTARVAIGQMLRSSADEHDIVDHVIELSKSECLCRSDSEGTAHHDPTIICSLGIRKED